MKKIKILLFILIIGLISLFFINSSNKDTSKNQDLIRVDSPSFNQKISNPLIIKGEARGSWFFEASFPVKLYDGDDQLIGTGVAQAQSDWMTNDFVPFEASIYFNNPKTKKGVLVLEKDNPSGLIKNYDEVKIDVLFSQEEQSSVDLYYYNSSFDKDKDGNVMCSEQGLARVRRNIPLTDTPIQNTLRLLLKGELTQEEINSGITTEYPLEGLDLKGATLKDGVLLLEFDDPNNKTSGGSCRANVLWLQISETAKQFSNVELVKFVPDYLFQP